jgi:hypothetical protein
VLGKSSRGPNINSPRVGWPVAEFTILKRLSDISSESVFGMVNRSEGRALCESVAVVRPSAGLTTEGALADSSPDLWDDAVSRPPDWLGSTAPQNVRQQITDQAPEWRLDNRGEGAFNILGLKVP